MVRVEQKDGTTQLELRTSNANDIMNAMSKRFSKLLSQGPKSSQEKYDDNDIIEEESLTDEEEKEDFKPRVNPFMKNKLEESKDVSNSR